DCWIDGNGNPCDPSTPGARFKTAHRVRKHTPGAVPRKSKSRKWYARIGGKAVPLSANKSAARIMLGEKRKKGELAKAGAADPFEEQRQKPLAEHLSDFQKALLADANTPKHAKQTITRARKVFEGCSFVFMGDVQASRLAEWLAAARKAGQ